MKSVFKKIVIFVLLLGLCVSSSGCGGKSVNSGNKEVKAPSETASDEGTEMISLGTLKTIPEFKCTDVNGKEVSNEMFSDSKVTLINLWGTWCSPCVAELPDLGELYDEVKDQGINVVGVVEDGMKNEEDVKEILDKSNVTYTNIIPDEKFYDDFMSLCSGFPASLLVDSDGNVISEIVTGARSKDEYKELINKALESEKTKKENKQ